MKYTTIEHNIALHVLRVNPYDIVNEGYAALFVECPDEVEAGWVLDGGIWSAPPPHIPTPEEIRNAAKAERQTKVDAIMVTTAAGNTFNGDEISQGRMSRAVVAMGAAPAGSTVNWVLADNSVIDATQQELTEALLLAGTAQAAIWVI